MTTEDEITAFINGMDDQTHQAFDPGWTSEKGHAISPEELRERVGYWMQESRKAHMSPEEQKAAGMGNVMVAKGTSRLDRLTAADEESMRNVRQEARRSEAIQQLCQNLMQRADPNDIKCSYVTLDEANAMHEEYRQARAEGYEDNQLDFLPLSAYQQKLRLDTDRPIRPLFANEFGVFQMASNPSSPLAGKIVCIRDPAVKGASMVTVPRQDPPTGLLPGPGDS